MKALEIMTSPAATVGPDTALEDAVRLMLGRGISGLPVVDGQGRPLGMLTEGDLLRRAETGTEVRRPRWLEFLARPGRLAEEYVQSHGRRVDEVMTQSVVSAPDDAELEDIVELMQSRHIKRVPIVRSGRVIGVVSRSDLVRALARRLQAPAGAPQSDDDLAKRVNAALQGAAWKASHGVTARVRDGIVTLDGTIFDGREREAFRVLAENVPGVRGVEDEIIWVEPTSGMAFPASGQPYTA